MSTTLKITLAVGIPLIIAAAGLLEFFAIALVLAVLAAGLFWLACLPGRLAAANGHPWPKAVRIAGWLGMLLGGFLWPLALIWAYVPAPQPR